MKLIIGGTHRGHDLALPGTIALHQRTSQPFDALLVDVDPQRAHHAASIAVRRGLPAQGVHDRVQSLIAAHPEASIKLHLDHPREIATSIHASVDQRQGVLGYNLWALPNGSLAGVALALPPEDAETKELVRDLFVRVASVTATGTSEDVVGARARSQHILLEPALRAWFTRHETLHLARFLARTTMAAPPVTMTFDGATDYPVIITPVREWQDPITLAQATSEFPPSPLPVNRAFIIGELGPDGVRLHTVRRRQDGRLSLYSTIGIDPWTIATKAEQDAAMQAAQRASITKRSPLLATD